MSLIKNKTAILTSNVIIILLLMIVIGISEYLIMQILPLIQSFFPNVHESILDAILLSLVVAPISTLIFKQQISSLSLSHSNVRNKVLLVAGLPLCIALILMLTNIYQGQQKIRPLRMLDNLISVTLSTGNFIHEAQKERDISALYIGSQGKIYGDELHHQQTATDKQFKLLYENLYKNPTHTTTRLRKALDKQIANIQFERDRINQKRATNKAILITYSATFEELLNLLSIFTKEIAHEELSIKYTAIINAMRQKELYGIERGILSGAFSAGQFDASIETTNFLTEWFRTAISQVKIYDNILYSLLMEEEIETIKSHLQHPSLLEAERLRTIVLDDKVNQLLDQLKTKLGYNGMIHHFKNFILRGDSKNYNSAVSIHIEISHIIEKLTLYYSNNQQALRHLQILQKVIDSYHSKLSIIQRMKIEGKQVKEIDLVVRIDDEPANKAVQYLEQNIWGVNPIHWYGVMTKKMNIMQDITNYLISQLKEQGDSFISKAEEKSYLSASTALILVILVFSLLIIISRNIGESFLERERALEDAKLATKMKSEFLANMSHEIRTPMNGVLGMLELVLNGKLSNEQRRKTELAQSSASSLLSLINDILDFSKVEAGKIELEEIEFNLSDELGNIAESIAHSAQQKDLEIILDTINIQHTSVIGDPGRLRQVFSNLLSNAIKFTQEGEIKISASLVDIGNQQLRLNCKVSDTGIGIPDDKLDTLFDKFTQVDASTTRQYGGTGLGLSIAKRLCEMMDGTIDVESKVGQGTSFEVSMIFKSSPSSKKVAPNIPLNHLNILIIDKNLTNRKILLNQLKLWKINAVALSSITEVKEKLSNSNLKFDAILLDSRIDSPDEISINQYLNTMPQFNSSKIILMTNIDYQNAPKELAKGIEAYISKPIINQDLDYLLSIITDQKNPLTLGNLLHKKLPTIKSEEYEEQRLIDVRVLLVEDNPINQEVAKGILEQIGISISNIYSAENGLEAIRMLKDAADETSYDIILMDCQMPIMDGYEASELIRNNEVKNAQEPIPIVAMTANAMKGDREKCLAAGMNDYLSKPIQPNSLLNIIVKWVLVDENSNQLANNQMIQENKEENKLPVHWDKEELLQRIRNNETLLGKLVELFYKQIPSQMEALETFVKNKDYEQIKLIAHTVKGVAGNLSALRLQHFAEQLEIASIEEDSSRFVQIMLDLNLSYQELLIIMKE